MVRVRLEPFEQAGIPKDYYVSVRAGNVQKLSRLAGARTYNFPDSEGGHKFGKLEVFRRVGAASINLEPATKGMREVSVSCDDAGGFDLGLRLGVDGAAADPEPAQDSPKTKGGATRVKAAKEYLDKHCLEVRLSEAMQAVLRERPDDPASFLAAKLCGGAPLKLPPVSPASPASPVSPEPAAKISVKSQKPQPGQADFRNAGADCFGHIYSNFPPAKRVDIPSKAAAAAAPAVALPPAAPSKAGVPWNMLPSSGTWLMAKPCKPDPEGAAKAGPKWSLKPSVGTWFTPLPERIPAVAATSAVAETAATTSKGFFLKPSVGTWLAPRLDESASSSAPAAVAAKAAPAPAVELPARAPIALVPSAASWLAPRPPAVKRPRLEATLRLSGLAPAAKMSGDERCEVERVLAKALLELTGKFEGDYFPLAGSQSFVMRPGGMCSEEAQMLKSRGLLFASSPGDASGQGVFVSDAGSVGAWINEASHVKLIVLEAGEEGASTLRSFTTALTLALKQDGYDAA